MIDGRGERVAIIRLMQRKARSRKTLFQALALAISWSCNWRHITLPAPDFGNVSTNSTIFGTL